MDKFRATNVCAVIIFVSIFAMSMVACSMSMLGCDNQQKTSSVQQQQDNWSTTPDGFFNYMWMSDGSCSIMLYNNEYVISRSLSVGAYDEVLSWKWEEDGDIDIGIDGRNYDLDCPFDTDDEDLFQIDSGDTLTGTIIGTGTAKLALSGKNNKKTTPNKVPKKTVPKEKIQLPKTPQVLTKYNNQPKSPGIVYKAPKKRWVITVKEVPSKYTK